MSGQTRFVIVDVFAEKRYAGNQLAVFQDVESFSDDQMQAIAKEMHFSETTFILDNAMRDGGYDVRIFTPESEVPFAGHPTLGTAFVIRQDLIAAPVETVVLNLKAGQIPVSVLPSDSGSDILWMKQLNPVFGETIPISDMSNALGLENGDLDDRFPIQSVSTGLPFFIVPVRSLEALKRAKVRLDAFFKIVESAEAKAVLLFCPEPYSPENDLNVRVFVDWYGIPEDPATGSGNGCLAGYLARHRYLGGSAINVQVEQGYEIGRPSLLYLKAADLGDSIDVQVGGRVVMVARGTLVT